MNELFDEMVASYERHGEPLTVPFAKEALRRSGVQAPGRVIDSGSGTGAFALAAAQAGLDVVAIDNSAGMVARLNERLAGHARSRALVMDGENLDLPTGEFDAGFSVFGATCYPDWHRGLAELVRVVRPGGRLVVAHWKDPNGYAGPTRVLASAVAAAFPDRLADFDGDSNHRHTAASLQQDLADAGCIDIDVVEVTGQSTWPPVAHIVDELEPVFRYLPDYARLDGAQRAAVRPLIERKFAQYAGPDGRPILTDVVNLAISRTPDA